MQTNRSLTAAFVFMQVSASLCASDRPEVASNKLPDGAIARIAATRFRSPCSIHAVAWTPDSKKLITADFDKTLRIWDAVTGGQIKSLEQSTSRQQAGAFVTPNGKRLLIHSLSYQKDEAENPHSTLLSEWDLPSGKYLGRIGGPWHYNYALSPDGTLAAVLDWQYDEPVGQSELKSKENFELFRESIVNPRTEIRLVVVSTGQTWRRLATIPGGTRDVEMWVRFSPDGRWLAVGGEGSGPVRIYETERERKPLVIEGESKHRVLGEFSPDGKHIALSNADHSVRLIELSTMKEVARFVKHDCEIINLAFTPDGKRLLAGSRGANSLVCCWDVASGNECWTFPTVAVHLKVSPDGAKVAAGLLVKTIHLLDVATGKPIHGDGPDDTVLSLAFHPDSKSLAIASPSGVQIWDVTKSRLISTHHRHFNDASWLAFAPDGKTLAVGGIGYGKVRPVQFLDPNRGNTSSLLGDMTTNGTVVQFRDGGKELLVADHEVVRILSMATGAKKELHRHNKGHVKSMVSSADGRRIALTCLKNLDVRQDIRFELFDTQTRKKIATPFDQTFGQPLQLTADGESIVTAHNDTLIVWKIGSDPEKDLVRFADWPTSSVRVMCCSAESGLIATGHCDGSVRLWDLHARKILKTFNGHTDAVTALAFGEDGKLLASGGEDAAAIVWQVK